MRKPFVCGNWKMNKNVGETRSLCAELRTALGAFSQVELAVAPVFVSLPAAVDALKGTNIGVAGQDCHAEKEGAYTGNVSAPMLFDAGCRYVILGHSERRTYHAETDALVAKKAAAALAAGLNPIVCVGETLAERDGGKTLTVVETQVRGSLADIPEALAARVTLAYEPVWAIGTGRNATSAQAQEVHAFIRGLLRSMVHGEADKMRIQYGGSVKPDNAKELMAQPDVDGALVGGASLKADSFAAIVKAMHEARAR
ncbi:MAG: triose-phosphate isomerase [Deltaproteobacteria bacterium]|nr:triose-phosphate isomerase [Deltaproteobacteria bacterium]